MKKIATFVYFVCFACFFCLFSEAPAASAENEYARLAIKGTNVNLRPQPLAAGRVTAQMNAGDVFIAEKQLIFTKSDNSKWYKIALAIDAKTGKISTLSEWDARFAANVAFVRADYATLSPLEKGDMEKIKATPVGGSAVSPSSGAIAGYWARIKYADSEEGLTVLEGYYFAEDGTGSLFAVSDEFEISSYTYADGKLSYTQVIEENSEGYESGSHAQDAPARLLSENHLQIGSNIYGRMLKIEQTAYWGGRLVTQLDGSVYELDHSSGVFNAETAAAETNTIEVSDAREFLEALGPDRVVEMAPGDYDLSECDPYIRGSEGGPKLAPGVSWAEVKDGGALNLDGIGNLTIRGPGSSSAGITVDPRFAHALSFKNCSDIVIEGLRAGHSEGGDCEGGVFRFEDSQRISVTDVSMYGCGANGLDLRNVSDMNVTNSRIYECTEGIVAVSGGHDIGFKSCAFSNNFSQKSSLVSVSGTRNASFKDCEFTGNRGSRMFSVTRADVSVSDSDFSGNKIGSPIEKSDNVKFANCAFDDEGGVSGMADSAFLNLCRNGSSGQIAEAIKGGANVYARDSLGWTPLMLAARYNENHEVTAALIAAGSDVSAKTNDGWTPLMLAVRSNKNHEVTNALVRGGADVRVKMNDGRTALMLAAEENNAGVTNALIKAGLDVNAKMNGGWTALMLAAQFNKDPEAASALIAAGANVNAKSDGGTTPLMLAAGQNENPEVVSVLLKNGADAKVRNSVGKSAIDHIYENEKLKNTDAVKELEQAVSRAETAPPREETAPPKEGNVKYVRLSVTGTNVNIRGAAGTGGKVLARANPGDEFVADDKPVKNSADGSSWYKIVASAGNGYVPLAADKRFGVAAAYISANFARAEKLDEEENKKISALLAGDDGKNIIAEIWHNGGKSWADNYHTVFYKDGKVEHFGHRNLDNGTYTTANDGSRRAVFDNCKYDFPGEGYLQVSGYTCVYRPGADGKELSRVCDRDDSVSDNDNYDKPLQRVNDFVKNSEY
ncbi:MAG: ankyrin repeat domain-containing protein [Synergistaceae bacterium]|nr:ankyrin repeat domain-containing protein [Synergistaceae bacterium]